MKRVVATIILGVCQPIFICAVFAEDTDLASTSVSPKVAVKGLFNGAAVLEVNGRQVMLKDGASTVEGVRLIRATSKLAIIEVKGKRSKLGLSQSIGTSYTEAPHSEVRLSSKHHGHFFGSAIINGHAVQFVVDTGASSVSMNASVATRLGIQYKRGQAIRVATAQGITTGYNVNLRRVEIGGLKVENVSAIVLDGEYPLDVLLGNSFLSKTDMSIESGVLIMKSKY